MEVVERRLAQIQQTGYRLRIGDYFNNAFEIFKAESGLFVLFTFVNLAVQALLNLVVPVVGPLVSVVITPPLSVGYFFAVYKIRNGQSVTFNDFFRGFNFLTPLVVASLIGSALTLLGLVFLVVPGIYLSVAYFMANFFIVFYNMSGWEALKASRKFVHRQWFDVWLLLLLVLLIDMLGLICLGVGLLVSIPVTNIMLYLFFEDVFGLGNEGDELVDSLGE